MRQKLLAYTEITAIFERFYFYKVVPKCGKSISAYTENLLKEIKRRRRKRQEDLAVYGEYLGKFSTTTKKIPDPKSLF